MLVETSARILAADDDPAALRLLERILGQAGFGNVHTTTVGSEVPGLYRDHEPDLILLDLHFGELSGLDIIRGVADLVPEGAYVPIIVVSGDLTRESRLDVLAAGATDFITKPYAPEEVTLRVRNQLQVRLLHAALEAQNRTLEARVRDRTRELEAAAYDLLDRLARAGELRDDQTGQHTRRVGELSARIARGLGLPEHFVELIRHAATLHDLGKIGVPDSVLLKPGPLTCEERAAMERHTQFGATILADGSSEVVRLAESIARSHHEHWDGSGYPDGLAGEQIPIGARIVALADFHDALASDRPYRRAWEPAAVTAEILRLGGTHFDPRVVDAYLTILS